MLHTGKARKEQREKLIAISILNLGDNLQEDSNWLRPEP